MGWGVGGGLGWCAKSFSCLTQLKVMLGWVELWLSWGFDNLTTRQREPQGDFGEIGMYWNYGPTWASIS